MLTADRQNERRKTYFALCGDLVEVAAEFGDTFGRREKDPSTWHRCTLADEQMREAQDALDAFLAELNIAAQERHNLIKAVWITCYELAGARYRQESGWFIEEKSIARQGANDALNVAVFGLIAEIK